MSQIRSPRPPDMTVDEFLVWADGQPGRWELISGEPLAMAPERYIHARLKARIFRKLAEAIEAAGLECEALVDGMGVRVDERSLYIPDVTVHCGPPPADDALEIARPLIIVEVASPSTAWLDESEKLAHYIALPALAHYLLVSPKKRRVAHLERRDESTFLTRIWGDQPIRLDPPGIVLEGIF